MAEVVAPNTEADQMTATPTMKLRPYQTEAVQAIRDEWEVEGNESTLISLPTGTGKTIVFSSLISTLLDEDKNARALVVAHRDELVEQAADKMRQVNPFIRAGTIKGARHEVAPRFVVGSIQSFNAARLRRLKAWRVDYLVIDEAHHAQEGNHYGKLIAHLRSINPDLKVLGVTATPFRGDNRGLGGVFASCCYSYGLVEAIESGFLTPLRGVVVRTSTDLDGVRQSRGDFGERSLAQVVDTANRNDLVVESWQKHANGVQAVAFACNVEHAQNMAACFVSHGVRAAAVWGAMGSDARKATLKRFAKGDLDVLTNCGVLTEGWDYPALGAVLLARPTRSRVLYAQAVGRATRLAPGKVEALVIDFTDNCSRLSLASLIDLTDPDRAQAVAEGRLPTSEGIQQEETFQIKPKGEGLRTWEVNLFGGTASRAAGWSSFGADLVASAGDIEALIQPKGDAWRLSLFRASGGEGTTRKGGEVTLNEARRLAAQGDPWRVRLECVGGARKAAFWSADGRHGTATIRWGAIGTPGREQSVTREEAIRRAGAKLAQGYAYATQSKPAVEHIEGATLSELVATAQEAFNAEGVSVLMRANAAWKAKPASLKQVAALRRWNVPEHELNGLTAGEGAARMTHHILRARLHKSDRNDRRLVSSVAPKRPDEVGAFWASFD